MKSMSILRNSNERCHKGRKPITIVFLGIDGSGKSVHSKEIALWLQKNGLKCKIIPFHYWLFADKLKGKMGKYVDSGREKNSLRPYTPQRNSLSALIKPPVALIDNILMYYRSKWEYRDQDVIIFDRFICATFIKLKAMNYNVECLRPIWESIRPKIGIVFDVPVEISIERQKERSDPYYYTKEQLSIERKEYLKIAKKYGFPVFNSAEDFGSVNEKVKEYLEEVFTSRNYYNNHEISRK